jgi:hypothetical protein
MSGGVAGVERGLSPLCRFTRHRYAETTDICIPPPGVPWRLLEVSFFAQISTFPE